MDDSMPGTDDEEWSGQQEELAAQVVQQDASQWHLGDAERCSLTLVGGLDISFFAEKDSGVGARHSRPADAPTGCEKGGRGEAAHRGGRPASAAAAASPSPAAGDSSPAPAAADAAEDASPALGGSGEWAVAALVVLAFPSLAPVYQDLQLVRLSTPYRPGFLGFRECPAYLELLARARERGVEPQVLLVDGFGVLHPRRLGSASQLGVTAGVPTIGVAKNLLHVPGAELDERGVKAAVRAAAAAAATAAAVGAAEVAASAAAGAAASGAGDGEVGAAREAAALRAECSGSAPQQQLEQQQQQQLGAQQRVAQQPRRPRQPVSRSPPLPAPLLLRGEGGEVLGAAVVAQGCTKPVYVSVGHLVSLETAIEVTLRCCKHRVPEPIRLADLKSRERVRQLAAQQAARQAA